MQFPNSALRNHVWPLPHDGSLGGRTVHSHPWYSLRRRNRANSLSFSCSKDHNCFPKKAIKCSHSPTVRLHIYAGVRIWTYWSWVAHLTWEQHRLASLPCLGTPRGSTVSAPVLLPELTGTSPFQFPRPVFSFQLLLHPPLTPHVSWLGWCLFRGGCPCFFLLFPSLWCRWCQLFLPRQGSWTLWHWHC